MQQTLLGIPIEQQSRGESLEKIIKYLKSPNNCFHIVSLNPEILVETQKDPLFRKVVATAQMRIIDGSGVFAACKVKGIKCSERFTGVELMEELLKTADKQRLRVMLLGGMPKVAEEVVKCQKLGGSEAIFTATEGIKDKHNPSKDEEVRILAIVAHFRPHIMLVSFGSPFSELWLYNHRKNLNGVLVASVGGAFDYLSGRVTRPSRLAQNLGIEYLVRLVRQPWRWRRQLNLISFVVFTFKEAILFRLQRK